MPKSDQKPVSLNVILCKLPLVTGTVESRKFHSALYYCWDVKIFESETIENFVKYKAGNSINFFYIYCLPYVIYLALLTSGGWFDQSMGVVVFGFVT